MSASSYDEESFAMAAHQVAHAMARRATATPGGRIAIKRVILTPTGGFIEHARPTHADGFDTLLIMSLAGREAAARWARLHKFAKPEPLARWTDERCAYDHDWFRHAHTDSRLSVPQLRSRAGRVVIDNWRRIERLTHQLVKARRLSANDF
ncbi:hypothetical protein [Amycolatopsis sp. DSM 110486]|uniref:hypothetical protein n=1 Tax=Amycolatopsis sp. DSM 110486 TaxID=2865832 RepID=UPI001C697310|nr:hypothetical protein [Amycolatopsis sp. DSM 110486]QYN23155.1 hypothetical protein K1T34_12255 [Amycolatopsis sp. DSM 110486]